ncbi:hypothetical protein HF521_003536 [Silurus meridionalis]|uniref:PH domain-containing protein n=1 Tax=Silurus meridionalis TaxID=175797 RepID=A0A8T0B072_SILME|nr:hypothetical protein HF521_003536 [Silurus meridionalis]
MPDSCRDQTETEKENSPNIITTVSKFADENLTFIRSVSAGLAVAGVIIIARSIRLTTKFGSPSEIPSRFIERNVSIRGKVRSVTERGLEVEHIPIHVPILSPLLTKRRVATPLHVRLAGVDLTPQGRVLFCPQGFLFNTCVNEEILRSGLGRTAPLHGLDPRSSLYWRLHSRLLKCELRAEKKGRGLWKQESAFLPSLTSPQSLNGGVGGVEAVWPQKLKRFLPSHDLMVSSRMDGRGSVQYCRHFLTDNSTFHVERCMSVMQSGTQMVKLKNGSKGLVRLFYLDEHRSCIRWRPSRKSEKAKITIDSLYKVTEGRQSDVFHRHADGNLDPGCCFTIYHGNHMDSLDLVTSNAEEARTWVTGLRYLMAGISDEDSLAKRQRTHDQYPLYEQGGGMSGKSKELLH